MSSAGYRHGLVIGKFYPLHAGHSALIRAASRSCDRVTVEVLASRVESIPLDVRADWVREDHPECHVVSGMDDAEIDYDSPAVWDQHMQVIGGLLDSPIDAVFTSDPYGEELARRLDATWVQVDDGRVGTPVSGTTVRADVPGHWWALSPVVRSWFARRVVVVGAESTGTTTLARDLAYLFETLWVPEVGREWCESRPGGLSAPWHEVEFALISREQARREDEAARRVPCPLLVCDTDPLATAVWQERYLGSPSDSIVDLARSRQPDLYVLTSADIPFVQDGLRDGEHIRSWMTERFREVLGAQSAPWIEVSGSPRDRLDVARQAVSDLLDGGWGLADPLGAGSPPACG
jgi:HTH-type transcriptional repressor of NAD biosynthesis genes